MQDEGFKSQLPSQRGIFPPQESGSGQCFGTYTGDDEGRDEEEAAVMVQRMMWLVQRLVAGGAEADLVEVGSAALLAPSC